LVLFSGVVSVKKLLKRVLQQEEGATALEYALLVVLIALVLAGGAVVLGNSLNKLFGDVGTTVGTVSGSPTIPTPSPTY
jgi:pilus assembly protein Flp/PilA